jgi:hypothetical protein
MVLDDLKRKPYFHIDLLFLCYVFNRRYNCPLLNEHILLHDYTFVQLTMAQSYQ